MTDATQVATGSETDIGVDITVSGMQIGTDHKRVLDLYESNAETFLVKDQDYGSSFVKSGKIASIYECGYVDPDVVIEHVAHQITTRMWDKQARLWEILLADNERHVANETVIDSLLDLANYATMLAAQLVKYQEGGFRGQHPEREVLNDLTDADAGTVRTVLQEYDLETLADGTHDPFDADGSVDSVPQSDIGSTTSGPEYMIDIDGEVLGLPNASYTATELLTLIGKKPISHGLMSVSGQKSFTYDDRVDISSHDQLEIYEKDQPES